MPTGWLWHERDREGIESFIARERWSAHVVKRIEIADALVLTIRAMSRPEAVELDQHRLDETARYFRILTVAAENIRPGYHLRVSVKYARQLDGAWSKFYQSCWFERSK